MEVIADTYLSLNTPVQRQLPALLEMRHAVQQQLRERVKRNLAALDAALAKQRETRRLEVEGGWYATLRIPVQGSDEEAAIRLLKERGVLAHPGHFFDMESDGYLIVSLITREAELKEGVEKLLAGG
jgi:aspartate/methionine/tyrosine aminotransferase